MAIFDATNATRAIDMNDDDEFTFDTQDTAINSTTNYSWLTDSGTDVQARGNSIAFANGAPTGGTIHTLEFDFDNNLYGIPDILVTDLNDSLTGMMSPVPDHFFLRMLSGNDTIIGSAFNDTLFGYAGNDTMTGGLGQNWIYAGNGNDTITEGGRDTVYGGNNNDRIVITSGVVGDGDLWSGGSGTDWIDFTNISNSGRTVDLKDGEWRYSPQEDTFSETMTGFENVDGGTGGEKIIGTDGNNILNGNGGDDYIVGGLGDDVIDGGAGTDTASYEGSDSGVAVALDNANPQYTSGAGTDILVDIENLIGSAFSDNLFGDDHENSIIGGNGSDSVTGQAGDDTLHGNLGHDNLFGGAGDDQLHGDEGNDYLTGGDGSDQLFGGADDDRLSDFGAGTGDQFQEADEFDGGSGIDTVVFTGASNDVSVDLAITTAQDTGYGMDTIKNIENAVGGKGNDDLRGDDGDNELIGMQGNDMLTGRGGADMLEGGSGFDFARFDGASSAVSVYLANDRANSGEAAGDTYANIEGLILSDHNDFGFGDDGDNVIYGMGGSDSLAGGLGADLLDGGDGFDYVRYDDAAYTDDIRVYLQAEFSHLNTGAAAAGDVFNSIEGLQTSVKNDTLFGNDQDNVLIGNLGTDNLYGFSGNDTLFGGAGDPNGDGVRDNFIFSQAATPDTQDVIGDFERGIDQVALSSSVFGTDESRIQFNANTTELVYTGASGTEYNVIATLTGETAFDAGDFYFY